MHEKAVYNNVNEDQENRINMVRQAMSAVYKLFDDLLKDSRESSLAYTKLEEAQFWAIKGISREKR